MPAPEAPRPAPPADPQDRRPGARLTIHPEFDATLSLAAVGLWHVIRARFGTQFTDTDVLITQPNAATRPPAARLEDLEGLLNELLANGWATHLGHGHYTLAGESTP